jgi:hypothetical protein
MDKVQFAVIPSNQKPVYLFAYNEIDALNRYARNRKFNDFDDGVVRGGWCVTKFTVYEVEKSNSGPPVPVPVQQEDDFLTEEEVDGFARYLENKAEAGTYFSGYWGDHEY